MDHADGHRYFEGLAVAHVLGGLDDSEGRVFRSHLLECGQCRARVGELRAIAHDLADVERDERRVRAAQAIETKRREAEDETDEHAEPVPSQRSSRITVIVGLTLIIGLSLWNFTLRQSLVLRQVDNERLAAAGVIAETGTKWTTVRTAAGVAGTVTHEDGRFVLAVDGLVADRPYSVYVLDSAGKIVDTTPGQISSGRLFMLYTLPSGGARIVVTDPTRAPKASGSPSDTVIGTRVFEAARPYEASAPD